MLEYENEFYAIYLREICRESRYETLFTNLNEAILEAKAIAISDGQSQLWTVIEYRDDNEIKYNKVKCLELFDGRLLLEEEKQKELRGLINEY